MISRIVFLTVLLLWVVATVVHAQGKEKAVDLAFSTYHVTYDYSLGIPVYISYDVTPGDLGNVKRKKSWTFRQDTRLPKPRVKSSDYSNSGYQRGHMCPAASRSASVKAMKETFSMANVAPQVPTLNVGAWLKMENKERDLCKSLQRVHVRIAPVFTHEDTATIAQGRVAVPHGFIKIIYAADSLTVVACQLFDNTL
jgi:endonuclease G